MPSGTLGGLTDKALLARLHKYLPTDALIAERLRRKTAEIPVWRIRKIPAKYRRDVEDLVLSLESARVEPPAPAIATALREVSETLKALRVEQVALRDYLKNDLTQLIEKISLAHDQRREGSLLRGKHRVTAPPGG